MARRARKRHVQQSFEFRTWGGKRKGAGRRPRGRKSSERHEVRPDLKVGSVLLITLRAGADVPNLRTPLGYHAFRFALYPTLARTDFRIVHVSIQRNHLHLLAEADSKAALARGMQGFEISAAKHFNGALERECIERTGSLFPDRYHERVLTSPRQVRNALAYVLNNWRRHDEDRNVPARKIDPYSSGVSFGGWKELDGSPLLYQTPEGYKRLSVAYPKTWLLRVGWQKAGAISVWDVPGPAAKRELFGV